MFDQLVESKSNLKENKKRGGYLLMSSVLVMSLLLSASLWSLFAEDLGIGGEEFELSTLIAPIAIDAPPEPIQKEPKREPSQNTKSAVITRQSNMLRIEESPLPPREISVAQNTQKSRPHGYFLISDTTETGEIQNSSARNTGRTESGGGIGIPNSQSEQPETIEKPTVPPPPTIKKPTVETVEKRKPIVSDGVINGQATFLPKPPYPPSARAVRAGGSVNVQVTIDETGRVISAKAIDGHFLLRPAAEKAAWSAKFNPTLLSRQPVKVTGVIVYKFAVQ